MAILDGSRVKKVARHLAKAGQSVDQVIHDAAAEVKKHSMPEGLPLEFKAAVQAAPDFALELVDAMHVADLPPRAYEALHSVSASSWKAAFERISEDEELHQNWQQAQAGDVSAQEATDSTLVKVLKACGIVGEAGMAAGVVCLSVGLALAAMGIALTIPTFGLSDAVDIPAAVVCWIGAIIFAISGLVWLLAKLILVFVE